MGGEEGEGKGQKGGKRKRESKERKKNRQMCRSKGGIRGEELEEGLEREGRKGEG